MFRRTVVIPRSLLLFLSVCLFFVANVDAKKKPPVRPVDINSASAADLEQMPGIGPAPAEKILQMRKSYGAFKSVDDLLAIRGIGRKRLDKMRKYLTVGKAKGWATKSNAAPATKAPATKSNAIPKDRAAPAANKQ